MSVKGEGHSLNLAKGHRFQNYFIIVQNLLSFETKFLVKAYGSTEMKIYINGPGHMIKVVATSIYGKILRKSSSSAPVGRLQCNLVCSTENLTYLTASLNVEKC